MNLAIANTILSLQSLKQGFGPSFFKKNINYFNSLTTNNIKDNILYFLEINKKKVETKTIENAIVDTEFIIEDCKKNDIKVIGINDKEYPTSLLQLKDAPPTIFCKGNLDIIHKAITVIGTRKPNKNGEIIANRIGEYFSSNWSISNGLALGVDECCIKKENTYFNNIIGVLGGGLNYTNSKTLSKNVSKHADAVLENNGLLISEILPNSQEDTYSVIKSCRIQAGIARALILVQSSITGGSKFAIKSFAELPRTLAVINPVPQDFDSDDYNANKLLILKNILGLSEMTELKADKIKVSDIFLIKSKNDYAVLEQKLQKKEIKKCV